MAKSKQGTKTKVVTTYSHSSEPKNAKQRMEAEIGLLHVRKQAMTASPLNGSKIKKIKATKPMTKKQQQKIAKAIKIAEKDEVKETKKKERKEMRKLRKAPWS